MEDFHALFHFIVIIGDKIFHRRGTWFALLGILWIAQGRFIPSTKTALYIVVEIYVYIIADIFADEHYHERESIVEVQHPTVGTLKMPGIIPKLSRTPGRVVFPGPALGEHNRDVFGGLLGLDDEQISALSDDGAI